MTGSEIEKAERMVDEFLDSEIEAYVNMIEDAAEAVENEEVAEAENIDIPESIAEEVVTRLINRGVDFGFILKQFVDASYGNEILRAMITSLVPLNRQQELAKAIINLPYDCWCRDGFDKTLVAGIIAEPATFKLSVEKNLTILRDQEHPLGCYLNADEYWLTRVRHYIVKKDYLRSVDELRKAWHGFAVRQREEGEVSDYERILPASQATIIRLINELYEAMVMSGTIASTDQQTMGIVSEDLTYTMTRYSTRVPRDGRKPINDTFAIDLPGKELVKKFITPSEGQHLYGYWHTPKTINREGILLLLILRWYAPERNKTRNKKRRVKYDKAMEEYKKLQAAKSQQ